ncbi:MAG: DUF305 domain-containing protein [Cyanobacteria bacterium Co-bin8]|nr:DUF305 domain-containing protein [Cyanobacteria bacterium Co-bin8]
MVSRSLNALGLVLGAVAIATLSSACGESSRTDTAIGQMDHGGHMDHGGQMDHGTMDHSSMDLGPADADYDLRFIDAMIPHHEGAVEMARAVLENSQRPELKELATEIIDAQAQEISQMQQWRQSWYPQVANTPMAWHASAKHMMPMSPEQVSAMRMNMNLGEADTEFDLRFINAMIPHHEGAVVMAQDALQKSERPEIQALAQEIIASQQAEIEQMQQWQQAWYGQ